MQGPAKDDDLVARAGAGDREAMALLYERHGRGVFAVARALSGSAAAEDIVQETFASALRGLATYSPGLSSVRSWLFAIARNSARRSSRRRVEVPTDSSELFSLGLAAGWGEEGSEWKLAREESSEELARAVASLSDDEREVVILRDVEGLSGEETAHVVGLSLAAMKSRLHRARLRLMGHLRDSEGGVVTHEREVGGIRCGAVLEKLGEYVDRELASEEAGRIDMHLRGCTVCERFGGKYAQVIHAARDRLGASHVVDEPTFERVRLLLRDA